MYAVSLIPCGLGWGQVDKPLCQLICHFDFLCPGETVTLACFCGRGQGLTGLCSPGLPVGPEGRTQEPAGHGSRHVCAFILLLGFVCVFLGMAYICYSVSACL